MNLRLERRLYRPDGIFGDLKDENGNIIAVTLEHAYSDGAGNFRPKVQQGVYQCDRHAPNRLPYETFELQNVPPFQGQDVSGILIHIGNYNKDSIGCVLVGRSVAFINGMKMITRSKEAFENLMNLEKDVQSFQITIIG